MAGIKRNNMRQEPDSPNRHRVSQTTKRKSTIGLIWVLTILIGGVLGAIWLLRMLNSGTTAATATAIPQLSSVGHCQILQSYPKVFTVDILASEESVSFSIVGNQGYSGIGSLHIASGSFSYNATDGFISDTYTTPGTIKINGIDLGGYDPTTKSYQFPAKCRKG